MCNGTSVGYMWLITSTFISSTALSDAIKTNTSSYTRYCPVGDASHWDRWSLAFPLSGTSKNIVIKWKLELVPFIKSQYWLIYITDLSRARNTDWKVGHALSPGLSSSVTKIWRLILDLTPLGIPSAGCMGYNGINSFLRYTLDTKPCYMAILHRPPETCY